MRLSRCCLLATAAGAATLADEVAPARCAAMLQSGKGRDASVSLQRAGDFDRELSTLLEKELLLSEVLRARSDDAAKEGLDHRQAPHDDWEAPPSNGTIASDAADTVANAAESVVDGTEKVLTYSEIAYMCSNLVLGNGTVDDPGHILDQVPTWCNVSDITAWRCAPTYFSTDSCGYVYGYFNHWVNFLCILSFMLLLHFLFVELLEEEDHFDDEKFQEEYGYSRLEERWKFKLLATFFVLLPVEVFVLYKTGLLEKMLLAVLPFFTAILLVVTVLLPWLLAARGWALHVWDKVAERLGKVETMLSHIHKHIFGAIEKVEEERKMLEDKLKKSVSSMSCCAAPPAEEHAEPGD